MRQLRITDSEGDSFVIEPLASEETILILKFIGHIGNPGGVFLDEDAIISLYIYLDEVIAEKDLEMP